MRNFVAAAKKYRVSLGWERTIYPCNSCKNKLLHKDNVVQSHLIRYGFIKNYTIWKFHGEADHIGVSLVHLNEALDGE